MDSAAFSEAASRGSAKVTAIKAADAEVIRTRTALALTVSGFQTNPLTGKAAAFFMHCTVEEAKKAIVSAQRAARRARRVSQARPPTRRSARRAAAKLMRPRTRSATATR